MEAGMALEPALYRGGLVRRVVVDDQMQVEMGSVRSSMVGAGT